MKKLILILVVVAMAAPLYAAGRVTFVATDNVDGTCTITFDANDVIGVEPVALGLDVKVNGSDPCHVITAVSGMDAFFEIFMDYAYNDPCNYVYGAGDPVADPCAAGPASLPSHHFCVSMGGLGGETDPEAIPVPDNGTAFVLTAGNLTDPCVSVTGHIKINALRGGVIGKDTEPMETNLVPVHLPFTITVPPLPTECVKDTAPFYLEWVGAGKNWDKPDCWCYERQCRGNTDGIQDGSYTVSQNDLLTFLDAFNMGDLKLDQTKICADFDHRKAGSYRCSQDDLLIFLAFFNKGNLKVPVCPMDWEESYVWESIPDNPGVGDGDDDYNSWCVPGQPCPP